MAKRFKLRLSKAFRSCRSKHPSSLPSNPTPSFLPRPPPSSSSIKRHVTSSLCGFRTTTKPTLSDDDMSFAWEQEENYHVVNVVEENDKTPRRKIYTSSASEIDDAPVSPPPPSEKQKKKKKKQRKKKMTNRTIRFSLSSADSALFSDEEEEEEDAYETLVLSSFSTTDSSSADVLTRHRHLSTILEWAPPPRRRKTKKNINNNPNPNKPNKSSGRVSISGSSDFESPRLSVFRKLIPCSVDGKVRESFAVVKRSEDPYEDFKRSMMEMITEKEMFQERELEQLLHCFLSLNAREHHRVIVEAFSEIWEALFCNTSSVGSARSSSAGGGRLSIKAAF